MAEKSQEKKTTKREVQLDRKIKELEEELRENKEILDRHFMVQQAKRAKVSKFCNKILIKGYTFESN